MLLGLDMADQVDQSFVKVHFHRMTTKYSNWLIDKIVDKEAERIAMREQFLKDNQEKPDEDNYEFRRRDNDDKVRIREEISDKVRITEEISTYHRRLKSK